jgi:NAD(P)-dependent dehydrogenase (short-subunit alcohol dehydrogenase family)
MNIEGHVALVTGANKGLGREVARQLARKGLAVYLGSRDAARGEEAMAALGRAGASVVAIEIDVTNARASNAQPRASRTSTGTSMFSSTTQESMLARLRSKSPSTTCERHTRPTSSRS